MNYDQPRQRADKQWDYTRLNDTKIWPVGYCGPYMHDDKSMEWIYGTTEAWEEAKKKEEAFRHLYHNDGHSTPEEARECYKQYMLDHSLVLNLDVGAATVIFRCQVCSEWTGKIARVGGWDIFHLCPIHMNREEVSKLFKVGDTCQS